MTIQKKIYPFILTAFGLLAFLFFNACEEEIDLELNDQEHQRIVVEGRITNEFGPQKIRLTRTLSYFQNEKAPVMTDVEVWVMEEGTGTRFDLVLTDDSAGIYETEAMAGKVGETYTLHIIDGDELYEASAYLDTVPHIDSLTYDYTVYRYFGVRFGLYELKASFYEPAPEGNIYRADIYLNDTLYTEDLAEAVYFDDFGVNDMYLPDINLYSFPQEDIWGDSTTVHTVRVELFSLSEDEFNFLIGFFNESYGNGSLFSGVPANIPTNIKNTTEGIDGVGFFAASGKFVIETTLIPEHDPSTNNPFFQ